MTKHKSGRGYLVTYDCDLCGKEAEQPLSQYKKAEHHFCSKACADEFKAVMQKGLGNTNWRGGKKVNSNGYVKIHESLVKNVFKKFIDIDEDGYVYEHRLKMVKDKGRAIRDGYEIHHLNGDKTDNRIENLVEVTRQEHAEYHKE